MLPGQFGLVVPCKSEAMTGTTAGGGALASRTRGPHAKRSEGTQCYPTFAEAGLLSPAALTELQERGGLR